MSSATGTTAASEVISCANELGRLGLVVGRAGNVSVRDGEDVLVTASRVPYRQMTPKDLVRVTLSGERLEGPAVASRELPLHLAVYRDRPDVSALVHTHSPHATAWSHFGEPLPPATEDNAYFGIGEVRTSRPAPAGSTELAEVAAAVLGDSAAVLLGGHGVLAAGSGLEEALEVALAVEHQAQVALLLRSAEAGITVN